VSGLLSVSPGGASILNLSFKKYTVGLPDPVKPDDQPTSEEDGDSGLSSSGQPVL
jgi:hypothetical protein